jgi:S-adenosylmethionine:tRNA ribosyltransferase-isomerase
MYALADYDYRLSPAQIAQEPATPRENARLMQIDRTTGKIGHHHFSDLCHLLSPNDLLVVNNTEVIPARLRGKKESGGQVDVLILDYPVRQGQAEKREDYVSRCFIKASIRPRVGAFLYFSPLLTGRILDFADGVFTVRFTADIDFKTQLYNLGKMPLPPYIKRKSDVLDDLDKNAYQTVFAAQKGAVAAPTAGLHFSKNLVANLFQNGIKLTEITLHVGHGTFLPVKSIDIRDHKMHSEWYRVSKQSAALINQTKAAGGRIIAVGTTAVRTLEYAADKEGQVCAGAGKCDLFIFPGYQFRVVDCLITNFHLPQSTLLMLVAAFYGRRKILAAYNQAIAAGYRFYSYGDAMLIV